MIRRVRPQRVVGQSPERNYQRIYASHPDHLAAGEPTIAAVYPDARNPFAHPELLEEGCEPWAVAEMYLMTPSTADVFVDITDTFERKIDALRCHVSQHDRPRRASTTASGLDAANAGARGLPDGTLRRVFLRVDTQ